MTATKVYVLVNERGDYSDYRMEVLGVYADRDKAQQTADVWNASTERMQECNNAITAAFGSFPQWSRDSGPEERERAYDQEVKRRKAWVQEHYPDISPMLKDHFYFGTDNTYSVQEHDYHEASK